MSEKQLLILLTVLLDQNHIYHGRPQQIKESYRLAYYYIKEVEYLIRDKAEIPK